MAIYIDHGQSLLWVGWQSSDVAKNGEPICPARAHLSKLLTLASNRKGTPAVQGTLSLWLLPTSIALVKLISMVMRIELLPACITLVKLISMVMRIKASTYTYCTRKTH